ALGQRHQDHRPLPRGDRHPDLGGNAGDLEPRGHGAAGRGGAGGRLCPLRRTGHPGRGGPPRPGRRRPVSGLLALTPFLPLLSLLPGGRFALPLLAPLTLYPAFVPRVRQRDYLGAWTLGLLWALLLSLGVIVLCHLQPGAAGEAILHGESYRKEMFGWIAT